MVVALVPYSFSTVKSIRPIPKWGSNCYIFKLLFYNLCTLLLWLRFLIIKFVFCLGGLAVNYVVIKQGWCEQTFKKRKKSSCWSNSSHWVAVLGPARPAWWGWLLPELGGSSSTGSGIPCAEPWTSPLTGPWTTVIYRFWKDSVKLNCRRAGGTLMAVERDSGLTVSFFRFRETSPLFCWESHRPPP